MAGRKAMGLRKTAGSGPAKRAHEEADDDINDHDKMPKKAAKKQPTSSSAAVKPVRSRIWFEDPYGVDPIAIDCGPEDTMYDMKLALKIGGMIQSLESVSMSAFQLVQHNAGKKIPLDVLARIAAEEYDNKYSTPFQVIVFDNTPPIRSNTTGPLVPVKEEPSTSKPTPTISQHTSNAGTGFGTTTFPLTFKASTFYEATAPSAAATPPCLTPFPLPRVNLPLPWWILR